MHTGLEEVLRITKQSFPTRKKTYTVYTIEWECLAAGKHLWFAKLESAKF